MLFNIYRFNNRTLHRCIKRHRNDSFTTLEEAKHIAKGVGIGIQICGNKVSIKNEIPIKLD